MTSTKRGSDLEVGDVIVFLGRSHRIVSLVEFPQNSDLGESTVNGPAIDLTGWRIARCELGWSTTVSPDARWTVA